VPEGDLKMSVLLQEVSRTVLLRWLQYTAGVLLVLLQCPRGVVVVF
jgi:hypothetical protein